MKNFFSYYFEISFWIVAMVYLASIDPVSPAHFSFCLFDQLGLDFCPGCGLGRSISYLFRGDIIQSFQAHWLGIPALAVITHRILVLSKKFSLHKTVQESHT